MYLPMVVALLPAQAGLKTPPTPIERLQAKIDVVSVPNLSPSEIAGQYTNPSAELRKLLPPMGSENLFLFPDKTYIYTFVADLPPETIADKGTWSLDKEILELHSDKDITWNTKMVERRHLIVRRRAYPRELFLMGLDWHLSHFERDAKADPEFMFLLCSLKRERSISAQETEPLRKKLMQEKWQPEFYKP